MNIAKKVLATLAIGVAALAPAAAPAQAGTAYFVVSNYTMNADVLAGPFRTYDRCRYELLVHNAKEPIHCEIKSW